QLDLLVELWRQGRILPRDLDDLFRLSLGDVLDREKWEAWGHADYPDELTRVAYTMLTERRPYDPETQALPLPILEELRKRRLLVARGNAVEFRHDKIRAYLAALHFAARWRVLLSDPDTIVDSNWDAMVEFHLGQE